jgi:sigma-B regulation protein RsbU (phosphoserine phosphatase)
MRVLIVEDDRVTRRLLQRQLEQWGHQVDAAEHGAQAWERFQIVDYSMVVSDWMMPEMDGLELVRRIRGTPRSGYVYVIMLTAKAAKDDLVQGMEAGADDFLSKPFDHNELRVRVRAGERILELERDLAERNRQLESANRRMKRELEAAAAVQRSLLPSTRIDVPGIALAWQFRPCDELAGDFLNAFPLDDNHLAFYVADVSGHGVVASLLSVTISRVLTPHPSASSILVRADAGAPDRRIVPPGEVARELSRRFPMQDDRGSYFSVVYGVLDLTSHVLRYVSAGHPPMIWQPACGEARILDGEGYAIGWDIDAEFDEHVVQLGAGDRLWIYSDGVPEAMNDRLEPFGDERLHDACRFRPHEDLHQAVAVLLQHVVEWCGPTGPRDDVSILALEVRVPRAP